MERDRKRNMLNKDFKEINEKIFEDHKELYEAANNSDIIKWLEKENINLYWYQKALINLVFNHNRVYCQTGRTIGKTFILQCLAKYLLFNTESNILVVSHNSSYAGKFYYEILEDVKERENIKTIDVLDMNELYHDKRIIYNNSTVYCYGKNYLYDKDLNNYDYIFVDEICDMTWNYFEQLLKLILRNPKAKVFMIGSPNKWYHEMYEQFCDIASFLPAYVNPNYSEEKDNEFMQTLDSETYYYEIMGKDVTELYRSQLRKIDNTNE